MPSRSVIASAGDHPVERAIAEGRIPESRRAHYMALMAKRPKKTAKLLASLFPALELPQDRAVDELVEDGGYERFVEGSGQAAPAAPKASGPTAYPKEWLKPGEVRSGGPATITMENEKVAAESMPGANEPGGLGEVG